MGSDACFRMGSTHQICQDYAIAGAHQGLPYAILSDGCSGVHTPGEPGSPFTDFGSRFLVRAASLALRTTIFGGLPSAVVDSSDIEWLNSELTVVSGDDVVMDAYGMARRAGFGKRALDATLLRAVQRPDGSVVVHQAGDGVVAARNRETGLITYTTMKFGNNMPYYLSYLLDLVERRRYFDMARSVEITTAQEVPAWTGENWTEEVVTHPLVAELSIFQKFVFGPEYDLVLIMSDGAESFQDQEGQIVPVGAIVKQLFDVKSFEGEFLIRRCNKFLSRFCAERGWKHTDDFSVAGIHLKGTP